MQTVVSQKPLARSRRWLDSEFYFVSSFDHLCFLFSFSASELILNPHLLPQNVQDTRYDMELHHHLLSSHVCPLPLVLLSSVRLNLIQSPQHEVV